jgi:acyl phosphate:glycerol-3-phosphate acyltransferase
MPEIILKFVLGYLAGSLVGSLIVGRWRGVDIRTVGSGNAGGTNALRTQGKLFAAAVVLIDVLKVVLPVFWLTGASLPGVGLDPAISRETVAAAIAAGAVIGHVWPAFFGFRGGKGMATLVGAYGVTLPWLLGAVVLTWVAAVLARGYVSLATILAAVSAPLWLAGAGQADRPLFWFALLMGAFVVWTHRSNIARLRVGAEPRMLRGFARRRQ